MEKYPKWQLASRLLYFVILHQDRDALEEIREAVEGWLAQAGLRLNEEKTRTVHTLEEVDGRGAGFDFLGFTFRQHHAGRHVAARDTHGRTLPFKTWITPSKEAQKRHLWQLKTILHGSRHKSGRAVVKRLNPIIRGWCGYYRHVSSQAAFTRIEHLLAHKLRRWSFRKHPKTGKLALKGKYWDGYTFLGGREQLQHHSKTPIVRHAKVRGRKSPYDGDWTYWTTRYRTAYRGRSRGLALHKLQKGRCEHCGLYFQSGDRAEVHHRDGNRRNSHLSNLALLHGHCHDSEHAASGTRDRGR